MLKSIGPSRQRRSSIRLINNRIIHRKLQIILFWSKNTLRWFLWLDLDWTYLYTWKRHSWWPQFQLQSAEFVDELLHDSWVWASQHWISWRWWVAVSQSLVECLPRDAHSQGISRCWVVASRCWNRWITLWYFQLDSVRWCIWTNLWSRRPHRLRNHTNPKYQLELIQPTGRRMRNFLHHQRP